MIVLQEIQMWCKYSGHILGQISPTSESLLADVQARTFSNQFDRFRMSKKGKKNLSGGMAGLSLEDGGSDESDEELEQVEVS